MISRREFCSGLPLLLGGTRLYASEITLAQINGVELTTLKGWHANIYPWTYEPQWSTVHPVPSLWDPPKWDPREQRYVGQLQSWAQIDRQSRQLDEYGSGADVLEFNVCPGNQDYNHWLRTYLGDNSDRPFYVLYEHIHGNCNYVEENGSKNMNLFQNKKAFVDDIEFFLNNVILPNRHRYVTVNCRAVIYLWAPTIMNGDFASLLLAVKLKYPVFFLGSVGVAGGGIPTDTQTLKNLRALDGFMDYGTAIFDTEPNGAPKPDNYLAMIRKYETASTELRQLIRRFESETSRKYLFIPTFQAAYDDTKVPGRNNPPMYPRTRAEMEHNAEVVKRGMGTIYDDIGPFVVYSELPEGAAVIESQCLPETMDRPDRFVGCGTRRLEIVKKYFSPAP